MRVRISKRAEVTGGLPAIPFDQYNTVTGTPDGFSIPVDYWIEGELISPITVGRTVNVMRDTRNGVQCLGMFQTSPVVEVTEHSFRTENSVYDYLYLTPEENEVSLSV